MQRDINCRGAFFRQRFCRIKHGNRLPDASLSHQHEILPPGGSPGASDELHQRGNLPVQLEQRTMLLFYYPRKQTLNDFLEPVGAA